MSEIYFTMDVEGRRTLETGVPTTYFIDNPLNLPEFCFHSLGLHIHISKEDLEKLSYNEIYDIVKKRKKFLEKESGKRNIKYFTTECKYFRPGWLLSNSNLQKVVKKLGMKMIMTNVRYYNAWLPRKTIIFIVHSYSSPLFIKLLIFYLKLFHPFAEWKTFNRGARE